MNCVNGDIQSEVGRKPPQTGSIVFRQVLENGSRRL